MTWLARTPQGVVAAHLEMLPRLQAEESLARANATAIGQAMAGGRREWMRRQLDAWKRLAASGQRPVKATPGALAASGIAVKVVPLG
jgi:hypothetical protein